MRGAVGQNCQNDFHILSAKRTQINVDWVILALINFTPLPQGLYGVLANLILDFENHIAIIGVIETVDPGLEVIARNDRDCRVFSGDHTVLDLLRKRDQTFALCRTILQPRGVHHIDKAARVLIGAGAGQVLGGI